MISGVILAAGESSRMGQLKQLLTYKGQPLVRGVAATASRSDFDEVLLITGAGSAEIEQAVAGIPLRVVYNVDWRQGQSTSVCVGVKNLAAASRAVMFILADQPLIDVNLINGIIACYKKQAVDKSIIVPYCGDKIGNPVLFSLKKWREELLAVTGDCGARRLIAEQPAQVVWYEVENAWQFFDIDSQADYEKLKLFPADGRNLQPSV